MAINKINENDESNISGGATFRHGADKARPYEVIDDETGEVVRRCYSMQDAKVYARRHNYSLDEWDWGKLNKVRNEMN